DQPSRFLTELGVEPKDVTGRPRRPLSVAALVAELRATTVDPRVSAGLREAAAHRLARLAALADEDGRPLVPSAHPYRWWGMFEPTESKVPLRHRDQPVVLSGSALDQLAHTCALQWFLGREVKADAPATAAQGFGNVVHVLADEVASGHTPADLAVLMERLDSVWNALAFDAPWKSAQEKENARAALERFLRWHVMDRTGRTPVASEHDFDATLEVGDYEVRIRGHRDRVHADGDGRAYVVDFKTGKQAPTAKEVERHPQLAVYQLAVREGAVDEVFDGVRPEPGGAELVHLRQGAARRDGGETLPKVQAQEPLEGEWVGDLLATAAGKVLDERFTPSTGQHCTHCAFRASCSARPPGRSSAGGSPPAPASTARTAPAARRAAPGRREGTSWSEPASGPSDEPGPREARRARRGTARRASVLRRPAGTPRLSTGVRPPPAGRGRRATGRPRRAKALHRTGVTRCTTRPDLRIRPRRGPRGASLSVAAASLCVCPLVSPIPNSSRNSSASPSRRSRRRASPRRPPRR